MYVELEVRGNDCCCYVLYICIYVASSLVVSCLSWLAVCVFFFLARRVLREHELALSVIPGTTGTLVYCSATAV